VNELSPDLSIIGVTGTNGKTSITHFIAQLLAAAGIRCGLIGTLGAGELGALVSTGYTTPDAPTNQHIFEDFRQKSIKIVAMEVSSHALDQQRVKGIHFHTGVFSNLTHDHLDYHKTFEHYWASKKKLWTELKPAFCVANAEDPYGLDLLHDASIHSKKIAYTTQSIATLKGIDTITVQDPIFDRQGIRAWIKTPWGEGLLETALWGRFNLSNLLAAMIAVCLEGVSFQSVLASIPRIETVAGRMMRMGRTNEQPLVVVDYAHTPDALEQALRAVRLHMNPMGQLWVIVGCGGDRDKGKRPVMAGVAEAQADRLIFTQDNPRTEDPTAIIAGMIQGLKNSSTVIIEYDRRKAIERAIVQAKPEDLVLVAGKGHESIQIIGSQSFSFSDSEVVQQCLETLA